jgi:hypothetical protein
VPPATAIDSRQRPLAWEGILWGILPIGSSILAFLLVLIPNRRWADEKLSGSSEPFSVREDHLVLGRIS